MNPQLTPHKHQEIRYGSTQKLIPAEDTSTALDTSGVKIIQENI